MTELHLEWVKQAVAGIPAALRDQARMRLIECWQDSPPHARTALMAQSNSLARPLACSDFVARSIKTGDRPRFFTNLDRRNRGLSLGGGPLRRNPEGRT
jgi:hypothetical protein